MTILSHDLLVIDQVTSFLGNDFAIRDAQGQPIGEIQTEGGMMTRMLMGNRQLAIVEADGSLLMRIDDVPNFGRDTFDLVGSDGQRFGEIVKQFTLFRKHLTVKLASDTLELEGSFWEREFSIAGMHGEVARVSRQWPGVGAMFLGKERYVLGFAPSAPVDLRAGIFGAVVALDLIRQKESRSSSASFGGSD